MKVLWQSCRVMGYQPEAQDVFLRTLLSDSQSPRSPKLPLHRKEHRELLAPEYQLKDAYYDPQLWDHAHPLVQRLPWRDVGNA